MLVRRDGRPEAHTKGVQEGGETNDTGESARWSARHCYYEVLWVASRHGHAAAAAALRRRRHHQVRHVVEQEGIQATRQGRNLWLYQISGKYSSNACSLRHFIYVISGLKRHMYLF